MKPNSIILILYLLSSLTVMSNPRLKIDEITIKGIYADPLNESFIEISQEKVYLTKANYRQPQRVDTLAVCDYRILNSEFIEIKTSEDSYPYPYKNYVIEIDTVCECCMITIDVPNISVPLFTDLYAGDESGNYVLDKDNNHSITLRYDYISDLSFFIIPDDISLIPFKDDGIDNGIVQFSQFVYNDHIDIYKYLYDILENYNFRAHIKIKIPNLTDATFTSMYIPGDYIRYKDKKLFWRGKVFKMMDA